MPPPCGLNQPSYYWPTYTPLHGWGAFTRSFNDVYYQNWQDPFAFERRHVATIEDYPTCHIQTTFADCFPQRR